MCAERLAEGLGNDPRGAFAWSRWWRRAAICAGLATTLVTAGAASAEPSLEGTWFLIIHYTDEATNNPDATRWLDRVWTFDKQGSRLRWTEYPIVVLEDTSGRFESLGSNRASRVLAAWEPNGRQLGEIMEGPRVNSRGSKSKSLRRTQSGSWASQSRSAVRSAMVVGYSETWTIENPQDLPKFSIMDVLSGAAGGDGGGSIYEVTEKKADGSELSGRYERDGIKRGTFRMVRTPPTRALVTSEDDRTPNERAADRAEEEYLKRQSEGED